MADLHGVFPYLVSPIGPVAEIRTEVLGAALRRSHRSQACTG